MKISDLARRNGAASAATAKGEPELALATAVPAIGALALFAWAIFVLVAMGAKAVFF